MRRARERRRRRKPGWKPATSHTGWKPAPQKLETGATEVGSRCHRVVCHTESEGSVLGNAITKLGEHAAASLGLMLRTAGSLLPAVRRRRGADERIVQPWREDSLRTHPSVGLTPSIALAHLHAADAGSPLMLFELFGEMLQKWPRLAAVEATRRLALTGLEWDVVAPPGARFGGRGSAARDGLLTGNQSREASARGSRRDTQTPAGSRYHIGDFRSLTLRGSDSDSLSLRGSDSDRTIDFCRAALGSLPALDDVLDHLANAIGYGIAVAELIWERGRLVDLIPVPYSRLAGDPNEPWRLRVLTEDDPTHGVAVDEQPFKWIVHRPRSYAGRLFHGGLLRTSMLLYLAQNLSFKDWLIYSQIAGMPVRVAQFAPGTPEAEKAALLRMLEKLGTDAAAVLSKSVDLKLLETGKTGEKPYEPLQDHCNTEVTILWLGQHLTTDVRASGSRAAAEIHDRVREDLLVDDIRDEAATLRRDVLTPMVAARFGEGASIPTFRRSLVEAVDTKVLADTLAVAVNGLRLRVPSAWAHRALGIPEASAGEAVLPVRDS
jgi:phage gp29-like protein